MTYKNTTKKSGFGIVDFAITTTVMAVMAVGAVEIMQHKTLSEQLETTDTHSTEIKEALQNYVDTNGYLPCPANPKAEIGGAGFGVATTYNTETDACDDATLIHNTGTVPVRTLKLRDSYVYDGWGNKFTYRISDNAGERLADQANFEGTIKVTDLKGRPLTGGMKIFLKESGAAYILISHGRSNAQQAALRAHSNGDFNKVASIADTAPGAKGEINNATHNNGVYVQNAKEGIFDDIVEFKRRKDLVPVKRKQTPFALDQETYRLAEQLLHSGAPKLSGTPLNTLAQINGDLTTLAENIFDQANVVAQLKMAAPSNLYQPQYAYYMAVVHIASPYVTIYNTADWSKVDNPATLPADNGNGVTFSSDGSLMAVAHADSPYVTIYNTADWSKVDNPSTLPTGLGRGVTFSPDGSLMAVIHYNTPYVTIYNTADWSKVDNPSTLPTNHGLGVTFSPDGSLMAVGHGSSPYVTIYNTADWSKVDDPSTLPTNSGRGVTFSPDGSLMAVAHHDSPYITIYNTADWSKVANPATLPPDTGLGVTFSPDGSLMAVAHADSPYVTIYNTADWSKIANPATLPTGTGLGVTFSPKIN